MDNFLQSRYRKDRIIQGPVEWKISSLTPQYENKFISIQEVALVRSDGAKQFRSLVMLPDSVMIVPITEEQKLTLLRPLRPGALTQDWEFPAERGEDLENIEAEVIRCAREEVGLLGDPTQTTHIGTFPVFPDRLSEICHIYALHGTFDPSKRTDTAEIPGGAIRTFTLDEAMALAEKGAITCTRTIAILFLLSRRRAEFSL